MTKLFVSTFPFGITDPKPKELLKKTGWDFKINDLGRKLKPEEIAKYAENCEALIAGTEKIDILIEKAKNLKIISRVGIGLDSVPLAL